MAIAIEKVHRITVDIYERMAATGMLPERGIELFDGLVVEMSPKGDRHNFAVNSLNKQFVLQARDRYVVNADSLSLRLGPHDEPEPDIALARSTRSFARERARVDEVALIVEVADTSIAFDLREKRQKYASAGIPEYWVVDLTEDTVHVFRRLARGLYSEERKAVAGEFVHSAEYPDVAIDVADVLGTR